ncbi:MAG: TolC family protein [Candidatus Acidiferrales bacterium]|jgi:cobalt-zinc-cadmium efflux system outer membrane protein
MKLKFQNRFLDNFVIALVASGMILACTWATTPAFAQTTGPVRITLDDAIQLFLTHNHNLIALRDTIDQSKDLEITAGLKPNPDFFTDWEYLPLGSPAWQNPDLYQGESVATYLKDSTEGDLGLSYLIERGGKRRDRLQNAKDNTAVTTSLVGDNERTETFQVATLFFNVQLAESTLDLANQDLASYQKTVDLSEITYKAGGMSEGDFLMIKLQLLQFQADVAQAIQMRVQALSDLRNMLGYESVPANYDVAGDFDYAQFKVNLEDLQLKALQLRPDYKAAQQSVTAAQSGYKLAKADGVQDLTVSGNYSHVNGINAATFLLSIPLAVHDRNQGEIARTNSVIAMSQEQDKAANEQVLTDVNDAYQNLVANDVVVALYKSGYLDMAKRDLDINEYSYQHGSASLLDFLEAERTYRATELAYRQALASWLQSVEQVKEAVGTRSLP